PKYDEILGQKCYKSLREVPEKIDIVDVFRKTQDVMPIAEDAIVIGAKVLWQQLGVKNEAAAVKARAAGLDAVVDRCVKIEHGRLFGGLNWRSEEHTSELQSRFDIVCRLLLEKKKNQ